LLQRTYKRHIAYHGLFIIAFLYKVIATGGGKPPAIRPRDETPWMN